MATTAIPRRPRTISRGRGSVRDGVGESAWAFSIRKSKRRATEARHGRSLAVMSVLAVAALVLLPSAAYAWTPGTHVFLGEAVMRSLDLLPSAIAELLRAFPYDFLYGSIAADTGIAKNYLPVGRDCHSWTVGREIDDGA